jgi:DNA-binding MarR family transcriptional regulator
MQHTNLKTSQYSLSDNQGQNGAEQLRQLSDEVNRIASTLARLSTNSTTPGPSAKSVQGDNAPAVSAEMLRKIIQARRLRARYFSEELFADPAWDMLLDLLQAEIAQLRVPVSSLCMAAAVPATTALRWLKTLVKQGLLVRRADPYDGRRVFVELAPSTSEAMRAYFAEVGPVTGL